MLPMSASWKCYRSAASPASREHTRAISDNHTRTLCFWGFSLSYRLTVLESIIACVPPPRALGVFLGYES